MGVSNKESFLSGIVERIDSNLSRVRVGDDLISCTLRGKLLRYKGKETNVAVGDQVLLSRISQSEGVIEKILPRKTKLSRPAVMAESAEQVIASNIDQLIIVSSAKNPPLRFGLIDRYLIIAEKNRLDPVICVNKIDLVDEKRLREELLFYENLGYRLIFTSALELKGIDNFKQILKDKNSVLAGHSGVGKSSLINIILPGAQLFIKEISRVTGKGKHATSAMTMLRLPFGGYIIDTPGIREFGLWDVKKRELFHYFPEIVDESARCRFRSCVHINEQDCAVKDAVDRNIIKQSRYKSYESIYHSLSS